MPNSDYQTVVDALRYSIQQCDKLDLIRPENVRMKKALTIMEELKRDYSKSVTDSSRNVSDIANTMSKFIYGDKDE